MIIQLSQHNLLRRLFFFLNCILLIMLFSCPYFSLFAPLYSLKQSLNPCSCSWVMYVSSLASPFAGLCFTSPWLLWNYLFVLLNPLTSSPILPHLPLTSLSLTFDILIMMCLEGSLFVSIFFVTLYASWTCMSISFTDSGERKEWNNERNNERKEVLFHYFFK